MRNEVAHVAIDDLAWEVLGKNGLRAKLLSQDPATGAGTRYVDIPQNWKGGGIAHYHPDYEEVFVIEGDVSLTGRDYLGDGSYIYRPSGIVHGHDEQAKKGCFCIIRFGGPLELCFVHEPTDEEEYVLYPNSDGREFVLDLRTAKMAWADDAATGLANKSLSEDAKTGSYTRLVRFPEGWDGALDLDPAAGWEWFVVSGSATLSDGTEFASNAYSCRARGGGALSFAKSRQGGEVLLCREAADATEATR